MKQNWLKSILPHVYAILIFLGISLAFSSPILDGQELRQSDNVSWKASSAEAKNYMDSTGIRPLWTNSVFGGMPTYQTFLMTDNYTAAIQPLVTFYLPKPINFLMLAMLGFYFLLNVMGFRHWITVIGAIAFGLSSNSLIFIATGHDTKTLSIAYLPFILGGILMTYRGRLLLGAIITCLSLCLIIICGHYQIVYYTLLLVIVLGIGHLVQAIKTKTVGKFALTTGILLLAAGMSILPSTVSLWTTYEYTKFSTRGESTGLTKVGQAQQGPTLDKGLDKEYAFAWSQGIFETLTTLVPNLYGGSTSEKAGTSSATYEAVRKIGATPEQAENIADNAPLYWGPQPFTEGPVYFGAGIILLFVLSLLVVKDWNKWWILAAVILGVVMAWGKHFSFVNYLLFDYLPFYNKFRAPSTSLVIPQVLVPLMACWGLNEIVSGALTKEAALNQLKKAVYITGGICVGILLLSYVSFSYSPGDQDRAQAMYSQMTGGNAQAVTELVQATEADRASVLRTDTLRSLFFVLALAGFIWLLLKDRVKPVVFFLLVGLSIGLDMFLVGHRYLNKTNYETSSNYAAIFAPSPIDLEIKADPDPYYRVYNTTAQEGPFNDALTSANHKSVGGYSAAKLMIYQDLIERQIGRGNMSVLNMLNTKYIIFRDEQGKLGYQRNPQALGNAWFVNSVHWANTPDEEMNRMDNFNPADTAVINKKFEANLKGYNFGKDSASTIHLTKYGLNKLEYQSSNSKDGLAVFSEIYYPKGWNIYVDGKPGEIVTANYVLRAAKIPAGNHKIEMRFEPRTYEVGNMITKWSSIFVLAIFVLAIALEIRRGMKQPIAA
ncbi:YfhO family protein [Chitinophaga horti]|uniref:YfhO family protein n=1 Tax=Chitinophaga horti TaxID=2920382 RepID=A0ABY6J8C6_9BACT|nr:YfhO family protein [Chitinophaga horti]UYQ95893.1 YfhO family protein [Chitinophaga horti]